MMFTAGADPVELLTLARMAGVAHRDPALSDGWQRVVDAGLLALGLGPGVLDNNDLIGFDADIHRNAEGRYVLAFRGSEAGEAEVTAQYLMAIQLAGILANEVGPDNLVLTGRSLGGGLASAASIATGARAVAFDAPALSDAMVAYAATGSPLGLSPGQVADVRAGLASGQVRAIPVKGAPAETPVSPR